MIGRSRIVLVFAIACGAAAAISGTVFMSSMAGEAKQPARRVRVTLANVARTWPGQTTTTDDSGAFTFHCLTPGQYELQAFKNAYLRASYGAPSTGSVGLTDDRGEYRADGPSRRDEATTTSGS